MLDPPPPTKTITSQYLKMISYPQFEKKGCNSEFLFSFLKMYGFQREDISYVMKKIYI